MRLYSSLMDEIANSGTTGSDGKPYPEINVNTVRKKNNKNRKIRKSFSRNGLLSY
jgi:hypothetical protein